MAVAEALAHGLPVVSTSTGAIPELVGTDAGLLVPPGNVPALSEALSRLIDDADLRARLAAGARRMRASLPPWDERDRTNGSRTRIHRPMNESLSEWLALREAADWAARSERLVDDVPQSTAASRHGARARSLHGHRLQPALPDGPAAAPSALAVVDRDAALLDEVPSETVDMGTSTRLLGTQRKARRLTFAVRSLDCDVETREMDLERLDAALFEGRNLVTASALLDLVSESWLRALAERCRAVGAAALFTITYDGRSIVRSRSNPRTTWFGS